MQQQLVRFASQQWMPQKKIQKCAQLYGFLRNVFCPAPGFSFSWLEGHEDSWMLAFHPEECWLHTTVIWCSLLIVPCMPKCWIASFLFRFIEPKCVIRPSLPVLSSLAFFMEAPPDIWIVQETEVAAVAPFLLYSLQWLLIGSEPYNLKWGRFRKHSTTS